MKVSSVFSFGIAPFPNDCAEMPDEEEVRRTADFLSTSGKNGCVERSDEVEEKDVVNGEVRPVPVRGGTGAVQFRVVVLNGTSVGKQL
jgi:hypothetical protein